MRQQSFMPLFVWAYGLLVIYLRLGIAESFSNFMLDFWETVKLPFKVATAFYLICHVRVCTPAVLTSPRGPGSWLLATLVWGRVTSSPCSLRSVLVVWPPWSGDALTPSPRPLRSVLLFGHPGWGTWCLTVALIWGSDGSPPSPFIV